VHKRLSDLGATPLAEFAYGDVGSPVWERLHADWNKRVWPVLLQVGGARPTKAAAARLAAEKAAAGALMGADSNTAMHKSLRSDDIPHRPLGRPLSASSVMRRVSSAAFRQPASMSGDSPRTAGDSRTQPRVFLAPTILTNAAGLATAEARVLLSRELQPAGSPKRTRHLEISLPPSIAYRVGDHLGVCPKNDQEQVERLAGRLGAAVDGIFMVPSTLNVRVVPKGPYSRSATCSAISPTSPAGRRCR
jgi:sulfite reductase alpha subunit-like flavoprotein